MNRVFLALDHQDKLLERVGLRLAVAVVKAIVDRQDVPKVGERLCGVEELTGNRVMVVVHLDLLFVHRVEQLHWQPLEKADFFGLFDAPLSFSELTHDVEFGQNTVPLLNHWGDLYLFGLFVIGHHGLPGLELLND